MGTIKDYFLQFKSKLAAERSNVKRYTQHYNEVKNIGILFNIRDMSKYQSLNDLVDQLKRDGKRISLMTYMDLDVMHSNPYNFQFDWFTKKHISVTGQIKSHQVDNFVEQGFDYLYCIYLEPFLPFDNILARSKAKCRVGKYFEGQENHLELMINLEEEGSIDRLIDEMFTLTKKMNLR
ncbi:DUF6913 domain-containing protein [Eisenibacter elegans]|jgi:hypothetical protein|uniref:DUF6913 domain-containing protein n=1 Tax=Eisenibacter elegans TaxID=997 RepID=UPI00041015A5|nr:hypothetical protein [Eisenibacter elegans]